MTKTKSCSDIKTIICLSYRMFLLILQEENMLIQDIINQKNNHLKSGLCHKSHKEYHNLWLMSNNKNVKVFWMNNKPFLKRTLIISFSIPIKLLMNSPPLKLTFLTFLSNKSNLMTISRNQKSILIKDVLLFGSFQG